MQEIEVAVRRVTPPSADEWEPPADSPEGWKPIVFPVSDELEEDDNGEPKRWLTAYPPGEGQLIAVMTASASYASTPERVAGAVNFLVSVLHPDDSSYVINRLWNSQDPFAGDHVISIIHGLIGDWTGKAPKLPSGSQPSRQKGGRSSTGRTPART